MSGNQLSIKSVNPTISLRNKLSFDSPQMNTKFC